MIHNFTSCTPIPLIFLSLHVCPPPLKLPPKRKKNLTMEATVCHKLYPSAQIELQSSSVWFKASGLCYPINIGPPRDSQMPSQSHVSDSVRDAPTNFYSHSQSSSTSLSQHLILSSFPSLTLSPTQFPLPPIHLISPLREIQAPSFYLSLLPSFFGSVD